MATNTKKRDEKKDTSTAVAPGQPRWMLPAAARDQYGLTPEQWQLIIDNLYPAAKTVEGVLLALAYCKANNLNIFRKPVNIVPMWSKAKRGYVEQAWEGFNSFLTIAHRTTEFAGVDEAEYGPDKTVTFTSRFKNHSTNETWEKSVTVTYPLWCKVPVYRLNKGGRHKYVATVHWRQIFATAATDDGTEFPTDMWIKRTHDQLAKCATVASLRLAFPEEMPTYCSEEMHGRVLDDVDYTRSDSASAMANPPAPVNPFDSIPNYSDADVPEQTRKLITTTCENALRAGVTAAWDQSAEWVLKRFGGDNNSVGYALTMLKRCRDEGIVPPVKPAVKAAAAPIAAPPVTETVDEKKPAEPVDIFGTIPPFDTAKVPDKTKRTVVQACRNALQGNTDIVWQQAAKWVRDTYGKSQDRLGFALTLLQEARQSGAVPEVRMSEEIPKDEPRGPSRDQEAMELFGHLPPFDASNVPEKTRENVSKACESARKGNADHVWSEAVSWAHKTYAKFPDRLGYALAELHATWSSANAAG